LKKITRINLAEYELNNYLEKRLKEVTPKTMTMYIRSLERFLTHYYKGDIPGENFLKHSLYNLGALHTGRGHQSKYGAERNILQQMKQLKSCGHVMEILQSIINIRADPISARDCLFTLLVVENVQRPGAIRNMSVEEVTQASSNDEKSLYTIKVKQHKTAKRHGPANIHAHHNIYSCLLMYIANIRQHSPLNLVFTTADGTKISSSLANKIQREFVSSCNIGVDNFTATLYRMSVVTSIHNTHKHLIDAAASQMSHKPETAAKNYRLNRGEEDSRKYFTELQEVIRITPSKKGNTLVF